MTTETLVIIIPFLVALIGASLSWLSFPKHRITQRKSRSDLTATQTNREPTPTLWDGEPADNEIALIEAVNEKLPQTQCAQCGYPGCRPYATAIIKDDVAINQCPPGGQALIKDLAHYLGKQVIPLNAEFGEHKPAQIALIDESVCIGCTLCIVACPVDAIVGANKFMHTVVADQCTGCELCLPPCPVDCISLITKPIELRSWQWPKP